MHRNTTGPEIVEAFGDEKLDAFISGIGTGGTISGAGEVLRKKYSDIKIYAVEPTDSLFYQEVNLAHIKSKELVQDLFQKL